MELTGRVTANAVISTTKRGKEVVEFSIAINDYYKPKGAVEGIQVTQYVECSYWISTAVAARLVKGSVAEISGRISVQPYTGKDGTAKASLNMHCNTIKVHTSTGRKEPDSSATTDAHINTKIEHIAAITEPAENLPF